LEFGVEVSGVGFGFRPCDGEQRVPAGIIHGFVVRGASAREKRAFREKRGYYRSNPAWPPGIPSVKAL
jgi:hypothetical protein